MAFGAFMHHFYNTFDRSIAWKFTVEYMVIFLGEQYRIMIRPLQRQRDSCEARFALMNFIFGSILDKLRQSWIFINHISIRYDRRPTFRKSISFASLGQRNTC